MIKLVINPLREITDTTLVYVPGDFSFNVIPLPRNAPGTLLFGTLELHVELTDYCIVYVWGYAPHLGWKPAVLNPPSSKRAALIVTGTEFQPGIGRELAAPGEKQGYVDINTGWVCLGNPSVQGEAIEFAPGCIADIKDGRLLTLWLHPKELPKNWSPGSTH
jgi:hypothetical protein